MQWYYHCCVLCTLKLTVNILYACFVAVQAIFDVIVVGANVLMHLQADFTLHCMPTACQQQLETLFGAHDSSSSGSSKRQQQQQQSSTADRAASLQARALQAVEQSAAAQTQAAELQQALDALQYKYEQEQSAKRSADVALTDEVTRLQAQFAAAEQAAAEQAAAATAAATAAAVQAEVRAQ
jgi:hypothetical protein